MGLMDQRSINQIVETWRDVSAIAGAEVAANCELCRMAEALREARDVLKTASTMENAMHMADVKCSAQALMKKWGEHD